MTLLRATAGATFWLGVALLAGAAVMFVRALTVPATNFEDLAAAVGALLLAAVSGIPFAVFLWVAWRAGRPYPATWRVVLAGLGALLALVAAFAIGDTAREAPHWGLLAFVVLVAALAVGGLYSAGRLLRARTT